MARFALSHSIKTLEDTLGVRLNCHTPAVGLTEPGRHLLQRLRPAFDEVAGALKDLNRYLWTCHEQPAPFW